MLALEPAFQTPKMKYVPAGQLLRPQTFADWNSRSRNRLIAVDCPATILVWLVPRPHFFATDDTRIVVVDFFCGGVRIFGIHISCCVPIPEHGVEAFNERACCDEKVTHDVDREAKEGGENSEKT